MTPDNYANIQRNLGILEGLVYSLPEPMQILAFGAIEAIDETIDAEHEDKAFTLSEAFPQQFLERLSALDNKKEALFMKTKSCNHDGLVIKLDGVHELDPCVYEDIEKYKNVTVTVSKCKNCGHIDISWRRQEDTEEIDLTEEEV